jgi:dihydrofolate synthase / folylpolyglutamate synthase
MVTSSAVDALIAELVHRTAEVNPIPRLNATRLALAGLGNPHVGMPVIHITGTNGKTSTSRMIESILRAQGLHTGLITSPHLFRANERIVIDGAPVGDDAFYAALVGAQRAIASADRDLEKVNESPLSFFEALTVISILALATAKVDVAIVEVGMGGEWDATNVLDGEVAVFAPIDLDHTSRLGATVEEIARTKSGIIKAGANVISAAQSVEAESVLRKRAALRGAKIAFESGDRRSTVRTTTSVGQIVDIDTGSTYVHDVALSLGGAFQAQNAWTAVAAAEAFLDRRRVNFRSDAIRSGLSAVRSPGRFERIGELPPIYIDAAHNPHGARALAQSIIDAELSEACIVLAVLDDKDAPGIALSLSPVASAWAVTQSRSERALPFIDLEGIVRDVSDAEVIASGPFTCAFAKAIDWALDEPGRSVVVAGTISVLAEAIERASSTSTPVSVATNERR